MQKLVGVRVNQVCRIFYFSPKDLTFKRGDKVIVENGRGLEFGTVVIPEKIFDDDKIPDPLNCVARKATDEDFAKLDENRELAIKALPIGAEAIERHQLKMRLVKVEYSFDHSRIVFYFSADGRVDFRELVRDLAKIFHTRIELRQIGVRDEAKMIGGLGCCGRSLCCSTFLPDFVPVSIKMAKNQNVSLNPAKISGICGRLMCCLKFEDSPECCQQSQDKIKPPVQGRRVETTEGFGKIIAINNVKRTATILLDTSMTIVSSWEDMIEIVEEVENSKPKPKKLPRKPSEKKSVEKKS